MTNYSKEKNPYYCKTCTSKIGRCYRETKEECGLLYEGYRKGFLAAEKSMGWHRNCAETPVPQIGELLVKTRYHGISVVCYSEKQFTDGYRYYNPSSITHWMEIPEVEE